MVLPGGLRGWTSSRKHDTMQAIQQVTVHIETALLNGAYGRIWMLRLTGVGVLGIGSTGVSGVMLRSTGLA